MRLLLNHANLISLIYFLNVSTTALITNCQFNLARIWSSSRSYSYRFFSNHDVYPFQIIQVTSEGTLLLNPWICKKSRNNRQFVEFILKSVSKSVSYLSKEGSFSPSFIAINRENSGRLNCHERRSARGGSSGARMEEGAFLHIVVNHPLRQSVSYIWQLLPPRLSQ